MLHKPQPIIVPADVSSRARRSFIHNYAAITRNTDRLFLFACDQKIEHMDLDFQGPDIHADARDPEHIFYIAAHTPIGALATHFGLLSRYGMEYPDINYIVKLNGKTNLIPTEQDDPLSVQLWSVEDVLALKKDGKLNIRGVGYTIYLGSEYENIMLEQAAQIIRDAHKHGLVSILWIYLRGAAISNDSDPQHLAGAAGIANSLGADFVKIKPPKGTQKISSADYLARAVAAAGNTSVICSGGSKIKAENFFTELYDQLHVAHTSGCAVGRNIFQRSKKEAIAFAHAIAALIYEDATVKQAVKVYKEHVK